MEWASLTERALSGNQRVSASLDLGSAYEENRTGDWAVTARLGTSGPTESRENEPDHDDTAPGPADALLPRGVTASDD